MRRLPSQTVSLIKKVTATLGLAICLQAMPAVATEVTDLYQAQVDAGGRTPAHQRQAMAAALREVAVKVSGRSDLTDEQLGGLLEGAEKLVQSYAYEGGGRGVPLKMRVAFDSVGVNAGLQSVGVPVWSSNRPKVLLWLVREENGQRRIVSQELDAEVLDQVKSLSQDRGLPFYLPLNDVQDMQSVSAADIWAGFLDNVKLASARYHPDIIVLAKVYKAGLLWQGDWQIVAVGGTHSQDFTGPDMASAIEPGIGWVTQDIASVYATRVSASATAVAGAPMSFHVTGIRSLNDYARVLDYLKSLVVIKQTVIKEVGPESLTLAVTSDTQMETIMQTLKTEGRLVELPPAAIPVVATDIPVAPNGVVEGNGGVDAPNTPQGATSGISVMEKAATDKVSAENAAPTSSTAPSTKVLPTNPITPAVPATPSSVYEFEWHG